VSAEPVEPDPRLFVVEPDGAAELLGTFRPDSGRKSKNGKRIGRPPSQATQLGVDRRRLHEWRWMAALSDDEFKRAMAEYAATHDGKPPSSHWLYVHAQEHLGYDVERRVTVPLDPKRIARVLNERLSPEDRFHLAHLLIVDIIDLADDFGYGASGAE
jgi:hypothetical protein